MAARAVPVGKYEVSLATLPPRAALGVGVLRVLVLGDSGAKFLGAAMRHAQHDGREMVAERGVGSCSVLRGDVSPLEDGGASHGTSCADRWVRDVEELRPDVTLVVLGGAFLTTKACSEDFRSAYEARLDDLLTAMGARVVAVARPLLAPALESAEAVKAALRSLIRELRIAMHCAGAATIADLAALTVTPSSAPLVAPRAR